MDQPPTPDLVFSASDIHEYAPASLRPATREHHARHLPAPIGTGLYHTAPTKGAMNPSAPGPVARARLASSRFSLGALP